jgi:MEDS: MEthanogen/methylotroph, DcmR Sensory domain
MSTDFEAVDLSFLELLPRSHGSQSDHHFVEIYDNDSSLVDSIKRFVSIGINKGEAAIVIGSPVHREALDSELQRTIDLRAARERGQYVSLDAEETLSLFMQDGVPDAARFRSVIGDLVRNATRDEKQVRLFGEMVGLLWAQGNVVGALALEDLWNVLSEEYSFRLFCAYPALAFGERDVDLLGAVCGRHSHVVVPRVSTVHRPSA